MACALANEVELAFESVPFQVVLCSNKQLLNMRSCVTRSRPEVGTNGISRDAAPAHQDLTFIGTNFRDRGLATFALVRISRQENNAGAVTAGCR